MDLVEQLHANLSSAYTIERELGGGGMARVFLAEEKRFRRRVVIKVLAPHLAAELSAGRFEREIEFAAQLQHPQIVPLFSAGDVDGIPYYTMPFIDGEPLGALLGRGPLSCRDTIDVLRDVAKALAFAHARGVVHRDIKPNNILVANGSAVVTDFGIAKAIDVAKESESFGREGGHTLTSAGTAIGTPAYMAPEQAAGDVTDHRADIYAFGCVAYEMLSGAPPFTESSLAALFAAHLTREPVPVERVRPDVPPALASLIARCLAKEPGNRPSDAELTDALDRASIELSSARTLAAAGRPPAPSRRVAVAVLPFKDLAADAANDHIGVGFADAAITDLASIKSLIVRPTASILRYRDVHTDVVQAARELGVDAIIDGSFQRAGNRLRVTVQLLQASDGRPLWAAKLTTSMDDIFVMQDEVSRQILEALELEFKRPGGDAPSRQAPAHGEAYDAYFRGRVLLLTESLDEANLAIEWFNKALEIDPTFAKAYAGLADAYHRIAHTWAPEAEYYDKAEAMCARALELDPQLPEGRYLRGRLLWTPRNGFDHVGALREFMAAAAAQPSLNEVHHWLGIVLFHLSMFDESQRSLERALAIDPHDRIAFMHLAFVAFLQGRFADALRIAQESGREISSGWNMYTEALAQIQLGSLDGAEQTAEAALRRFPGDVLFYPIRAVIAALRGNRVRTLEMIDLTIRHRKAYGHYHHAQYDVACAYAVLGDASMALQWLIDAAHNGFPCSGFFKRDPLLTSLRSDERYIALMADTDAECERYAAIYRELSVE